MENSPLRFLDYDVSLMLAKQVKLSQVEEARRFHTERFKSENKDNQIADIFKNIHHNYNIQDYPKSQENCCCWCLQGIKQSEDEDTIDYWKDRAMKADKEWKKMVKKMDVRKMTMNGITWFEFNVHQRIEVYEDELRETLDMWYNTERSIYMHLHYQRPDIYK